MRLRRIVAAAFAATTFAAAPSASAFCGFYVSGADTKLVADATQVVLMREGTRTVLSMQNDYKGPPEKFAMIVPVPVVLAKENVKILPRAVFDRVDKLGAPRLVEYWEQDPCPEPGNMWGAAIGDSFGAGGLGLSGIGEGGGGRGNLGVKVEARFEVGEYEIVVLSAKNAAGLDTWLREEKYAIPAGAEPFLRPYVQSGMKFFVAKVDPTKIKFEDGRAALSPLRFHYDAETFSLPVKLGMINSAGTQDLVVNIVAKNTRYEVMNYPNVTIPTNLEVAESVRPRFGEFYASLFDSVVAKNPRAVVTEYAWGSGSCDPCPGPTLDGDDLATLGADVIPGGTEGLTSSRGGGGSIGLGGIGTLRGAPPPQLRDDGAVVTGRLPVEVVKRIARQWFGKMRLCYEAGLAKNPKLAGKVVVTFTIDKTGAPTKVNAAGGTLPDADVKACVAKAFQGMSFPQPEGGTVDVTYPIDLAPAGDAGVPIAPPFSQFVMQSATPYVLTRLHVRYGKDGLGEDLIFRKAPAITGGREEWSDGALAKTARPDPTNTFQARYAIRHAWTGPIACKEPRRGVWGGPPRESEAGASTAAPAPVAAQKTAFAPRGSMALASFLVDGAKDLGLASGADGGPAPSDAGMAGAEGGAAADGGAAAEGGAAAPGPAPRSGCAGCALAPRHDRGLSAALAALAFACAVAFRRARRRP
jgi:hypothetical protein